MHGVKRYAVYAWHACMLDREGRNCVRVAGALGGLAATWQQTASAQNHFLCIERKCEDRAALVAAARSCGPEWWLQGPCSVPAMEVAADVNVEVLGEDARARK